MKGVVALGLLATTYAADTFRFTQCECPNFEFASEQKQNFADQFKIVGEKELFKCPGDGAFPDESGVVVNIGKATGGLVAEVSEALFQDVTGAQIGFHAVFQLAFTPVVESKFDILSLLDAAEVSTPILSIAVQEAEKVSFVLNEKELAGEVKADQESEFTIVVGHAIAEQRDPESFLCVNINAQEEGSKFECITSGAIKLPPNARFEIFGAEAEVAEMEVKVQIALFDNGKTDNLPNDQDVLELLADISTEILKELPAVVSLPVANDPIEFDLEPNQVLNVDLFTILSKGTLGPDELTFSVVTDPENGELAIEEIPNVTYTPNQDFIGDDLIRFKYEIKEPFVCANEVDIKLAIEEEEEEEEAFDVAPIVFGIGGTVIGLLVVGVFIVPMFKSKGSNDTLGLIA